MTVFTTSGVVEELRHEGFDVTYSYLQTLYRDNPHLRPQHTFGRALVWTETDLERLQLVLEERGRKKATNPRDDSPNTPQDVSSSTPDIFSQDKNGGEE